IWAGGRRRRKSAARWTRATARRRNGPRRSTTSLGDLRRRAAAPHGGPSRGSLIHNIDEGMATDENNHKNEARDDWTGCTFRVDGLHAPPGPNGLLRGRHV
ncbi:unnamed protein product, partial [Pelagomonas calceolata]